MGSDPVTVSKEVFKNISVSLDTNKDAGMDKIAEKFLSDVAKVLALLSRNLIDLSIILSVFSGEGNIAKLNPVFKKGSTADPKKLWPISLLPLV